MTKRGRYHSIKFKLISVILIMVVVFAGFIACFFPGREKRQALDSLKNKAESLAHVVGFTSNIGLEFNDTSTIDPVIKGLEKDKDLLYAYLVTADKEVFVSHNPREAEVDLESIGFSDKIVRKQIGDVYQICTPIASSSSDDIVGYLLLGFSLEELLRQSVTNFWVAIIIGLVFILVTVAMIFLVSSKIVASLQNVIDKIAGLSQGRILDLKRIDEERNDEIGDLVQAFNSLLLTLTELAEQAQIIANDDLYNTRLMTTAEGDLSSAFAKMVLKLRALTEQARLIAADDLENEFLKDRAQGDLSGAFAQMVSKFRNLARQSRTIAEGNLKSTVLSTDSTGTLGGAFSEMVRNLKPLAEQAELIAAGELSAPALQTAIKGDLGKAFKVMSENLKELLGNIRKVSVKIKLTFSEILTAAENMMGATQTQSDKITDTSAAITEMSASIQQISDSCNRADQMATDAEESAAQGAVAVQDTIEGLTTVTDIIREAFGMTKKLGEKSLEIGNIIETITEISEQTNLLALNAAIEAARAGEHGRGFAVVAAEVRKLAERTAASAKEIGEIIATIQTEIASINNAMDKSNKAATRGKELAETLDGAFSNIQVSVKKSTASMEQIAQAMSQQADVCDEIVGAIDTITIAVKDTDSRSNHLLNQVEAMKETAENLDSQIKKFKI